MTLSPVNDEPGAATLMRSGTAARLAGLSTSTLRIWAHRYSVVAPPKSAAGQRTYSMKDIERLRLIKRLTSEGHAIGAVARFDVDALLTHLLSCQVPSLGVQRIFVVGHAAERKLAGRLRPVPAFVFDDLDHAEREVARAGAVDVLVLQVPTLHAALADRVIKLRDNLLAPNVIVVYSLGTEAIADALRAAGATVRREPVAGKELARLIVASRPIDGAAAGSAESASRQFSDAELIALTEMPSMVACECPRHLAEIVTLLVGFEQYSNECAVRNQNDAVLHRHLHAVTARARTMLEQALARLVIEERLVF